MAIVNNAVEIALRVRAPPKLKEPAEGAKKDEGAEQITLGTSYGVRVLSCVFLLWKRFLVLTTIPKKESSYKL